jgi:hypothetical protein
MPLKLKDMKERIESGHSVLFKGRIISSVDKLPTAAEIASTDEEKTAAADDLKAQMQKMQAQLDQLESSKKGSSSGENSETGGGDEADTFESLMKLKHEELFARAEPIAKEKGIELDPKTTKAELTKLILGEDTAE